MKYRYYVGAASNDTKYILNIIDNWIEINYLYYLFLKFFGYCVKREKYEK